MKEEIGISAPLKKVLKFSWMGDYDKVFQTVFTCVSDTKPILNDEVAQIYWMDIKTVKDRITKQPEEWSKGFMKGFKLFIGQSPQE